MTRLSVNINKIATIRNARGGNMPDVLKAASDCERFGAEGITVHPRPDERHIRYDDVRRLKPIVTTEFNIEGNPIPSFIDLVLENKPAQVTLVPSHQTPVGIHWYTESSLQKSARNSRAMVSGHQYLSILTLRWQKAQLSADATEWNFIRNPMPGCSAMILKPQSGHSS